MAKSTRSKTKRSFRSKKREEGKYAAVEAGRLNRLNSKLAQIVSTRVQPEADDRMEEEDLLARGPKKSNESDIPSLDAGSSKKVSTHGPRGSRREEWRKSKGLKARPAVEAMNRQGGLAARRKAGRSSRRR